MLLERQCNLWNTCFTYEERTSSKNCRSNVSYNVFGDIVINVRPRMCSLSMENKFDCSSLMNSEKSQQQTTTIKSTSYGEQSRHIRGRYCCRTFVKRPSKSLHLTITQMSAKHQLILNAPIYRFPFT